jgi:hypothetical protein
MSGAIPPLTQYAFMAWCLVKAQGYFTFTFTLGKRVVRMGADVTDTESYQMVGSSSSIFSSTNVTCGCRLSNAVTLNQLHP